MGSEEAFLRLIERQEKFFETIIAKFTKETTATSTALTPKLKETLAAGIQEFHYDPDNGITFASWFKRFEDVFMVDAASLDEKTKVRLLVQKLGTNEHAQYCNYILPKHPRDLTFQETQNRLETIFGDRSSLFNIRYNCLKISREAEEDIVSYTGRVNKECERFKLKSITDEQFKSLIFVAGLTSSEDADIRTRLLSKLDSVQEFSVQEMTAEYLRLMNLKHDSQMVQGMHSSADITTVDKVTRFQRPFIRQRPFVPSVKPPAPCWKCGAWHFVRFCPFQNHVCQKCHRIGHRETHCIRTPTSDSRIRRQSNIVHTASTTNFIQLRKYITLLINNCSISLQIDTASDITIISHSSWCTIGQPPLKPTKRVARNATGQSIPFIGEFECKFSFRDISDNGICYVSSCNHLNLLGIEWIERLNLWNVPLNSVCDQVNPLNSISFCDVASVSTTLAPSFLKSLQAKHTHLFDTELGLCTKANARLYLEPGTKPIYRPKRPVPYAVVDKIDKELDRLEHIGVLSKVNYSSWAAPIVAVRKANGTVRLCGDFSTGLNSSLQTHQYPLPVPEDLFAKLNGCKVFSKIDLSDAYLQVPVDESCKEYLTINTHRGLYRYNRMPFGVKCAPAIFQQIMDTMLSDLPFSMAYMDDVIVYSTSVEEHKEHLQKVFQRIEDYGFSLQTQKCELFLPQIKYLGFIVDEQGRRPDSTKIAAIKDIPIPRNKSELQAFLGLVNYYNSFVPRMHSLRAPLNELLRKDVKWTWSQSCQQAFNDIKSILSSDLLLTHYDPSLRISVAADASDYGIGAVLLHTFPDGHQKAVCHASRTLTSAERNYSQIEKEGLALIFAVKKFHKMLQGRTFTLYTDHKPLLAIFSPKKGISPHTANRLQRWATLLIGYDFVLKFINTESFGHADALSRLISERSRKQSDEDLVVATIETDTDVRHVFKESIRHLPVTASMIQKATRTDSLLSTIIVFLKKGWPMNTLHEQYKPFYIRKESLTVIDGCLMMSDRVVIPENLREEVLKQFHCGHPGITRMKAIARSYAYWPNIDSEIEQLVKKCESCALAAKAPMKAEICKWPTPSGPWQRIHIDFAGPSNNLYFLVIVDAFSKWPEIIPMKEISTSSTIAILNRLFAQFGVPDMLVSDNGCQFTSAEFSNFCASLTIEHVRSPIYHPQSNGQAERFVDTFKRALRKMHGEGRTEDLLQVFLRTYRSTPSMHVPNNSSPAEAFLGRRIKTIHDAMKPQILRKETINRNQHNGFRTADLKFQVGEPVYVLMFRNFNRSWVPAVVKRRKGSVLRDVQVGDEIQTRHINHLRPRYTENNNKDNSIELPLDVLLDTFDLPNAIPDTNQTEKDLVVQNSIDRRHSIRTRTPIRRFIIDPKRKTYF